MNMKTENRKFKKGEEIKNEKGENILKIGAM